MDFGWSSTRKCNVKLILKVYKIIKGYKTILNNTIKVKTKLKKKHLNFLLCMEIGLENDINEVNHM